MAAAANETFTVKIRTMTGEIPIRNVTMNSGVENLKTRVYAHYTDSTDHDVDPRDVRLFYMTPGTGQFIELVSGYLREYDIDFSNPQTVLDMLIQPIETDQWPAATLADLVEPEEYKVDVPENTTVVHELSSELNFKTIYIVNQPEDKEKGLRCTVKYISVNGPVKITILDVHMPGNPADPDHPDDTDHRLFHRTQNGIGSTLLYPYVDNHVVFVENPAHGGRKKRTRRTRRKLHKKRTHSKHRNHRRMSR